MNFSRIYFDRGMKLERRHSDTDITELEKLNVSEIFSPEDWIQKKF